MRTRIAFAALILLLSLRAFAQPQRTFVSTTGNDANDCTRPTPCRNFAAAVSAVASSGEVVALDSGGFGVFNVSKDVSVISPTGVYAAVTALSGPGITVSGVDIRVTLRGLYINGLGGSNGIEFSSGHNLHVENLVVSGFPSGAAFAASADGARFTLRDSEFRQVLTGLNMLAVPGALEGSIDHSRFDALAPGGTGVVVRQNGKITMRDSVIFGAPSSGVAVVDGVATLENCTISNAGAGVVVGITSAAVARISSTTITKTNAAITKVGSGEFVSFGNNRFDGNNDNGTFDTTIALK